MKLKCWACAVIGFLLLCSYVRSEEKSEPKLPLTKGTVVRVTDKEFVVQSSDEKVGEVAYPLAEVSWHVTLEGDASKQSRAEEKTKDKYFRPKQWHPADVQPGSKVKVGWGMSHVVIDEKVGEEGNYYQITVTKLPDTEKDTDRPKKKD